MPRYIDVYELELAIIDKGQANERGKYIVGDIWELTGAEIRAVIDSLPSIDIVRCGECKHCQTDELYDVRWCDGRRVAKDHFCSYGERKDDLSLCTDNSNHCVCCGAVIPEGRMVCPTCERRVNNATL